MANGEPNKAERDYFSRRIRIAAAFKRATHGNAEITCDLFGETEENHLRFVPPKKLTKAEAEEKRSRLQASRKVAAFNHKLARTRRAQAKTGGLYGITAKPYTERSRQRWLSHVGKAPRAFDCAISAALHRNAAMAKKHPGHSVFLVDLEAVWKKWGCACGNHTRGNEHAGEDAAKLQRNARTTTRNRHEDLAIEGRARLASS